MNNEQAQKTGTTPGQAIKGNQSISQEERELIDQQLPKWLNGFGTQKELSPPKQTLWDPKYSALGIVVIALMVVIIDILPRLIRSKLNQATTPEPIELNEFESLLVTQLDSLSSDAS